MHTHRTTTDSSSYPDTDRTSTGGEGPMSATALLGPELETDAALLEPPLDTALPEADVDVTLPCWTASPDLWFAESPADVEAAKALCAGCPLRDACLAGALERREPWGVWGGQLVLQGVVVPRKRPRGRPRKADALAYAAATAGAA